MKAAVVIDRDVLGWGDAHKEDLQMSYFEMRQVGKHQDLPQGASDEKIAAYCKENGFDLVTGDSTAYMKFFEVGVKTVRIERCGTLEDGKKWIYLVQIQK